jgi:hypothetical protein
MLSGFKTMRGWAVLPTLVCGVAAAPSPPPGNCSPDQHRTLQDAVDAACKIPRRCDLTQDCATLLSNHRKNLACASARNTVNVICFEGGDSGHRRAAAEALNAAQRCISLMISKKCSNCPCS